MNDTTPELLETAADGVATLTLNRPERLNPLSESMLAALQDALDRVAADPSVRVVVLTGAGRAFCAGHDLKEMHAHRDQAYQESLFERCTRMMMSIVGLPQPVVARVNGLATAAGCQLLATCDLAVASTEARIAVNGIDHGLFCSTPSVPLSRNVARKQGLRDALHRRVHRRRDGARPWPREPGGPARGAGRRRRRALRRDPRQAGRHRGDWKAHVLPPDREGADRGPPLRGRASWPAT